MAVALGLAGAAGLTGLIAVGNAKREIDAVVDGKVQKKIDKRCAKLDKEEVRAPRTIFRNLTAD